MSPAAKRVVSKINNLGLPIVIEKDVINLTVEEKICVILNELPNKIKVNTANTQVKSYLQHDKHLIFII